MQCGLSNAMTLCQSLGTSNQKMAAPGWKKGRARSSPSHNMPPKAKSGVASFTFLTLFLALSFPSSFSLSHSLPVAPCAVLRPCRLKSPPTSERAQHGVCLPDKLAGEFRDFKRPAQSASARVGTLSQNGYGTFQ